MNTNKRQQTTPVNFPSRPSILVVLMGSLGDLVRGLCIPGDIKRNWPQATLTWLVEPGLDSLVGIHPLIDEVIVFDRPRKMAGVGDLRRTLGQYRFDVCLDLQRHFKSGLFAWLSQAPVRIGVHPRNAKEFNWIFNTHHLPYFNPRKPKIDHYRSFISYLGGRPVEPPDFGLRALQSHTLPNQEAGPLRQPYIVVVMGSSWVSKDWTREGYLGLLNRLLGTGPYEVVLVGDKTQSEAAASLERAAGSARLHNLTGRTSLTELVTVLGKAAAGIGPDSGPGHLAAAVGTPYVALFGPTDPDRVAPFRCRAFVVRAEEACLGCYRKTCRHGERNCMAAITPAMVMPKLEAALLAGRLF